MDFKLHVYDARNGYEKARIINLLQFCEAISVFMKDITFLSVNIVMVTSDAAGVFFISLETGECVARGLTERSGLLVGQALGDDRVCVGGEGGYCRVFDVPKKVVNYIAHSTGQPNVKKLK